MAKSEFVAAMQIIAETGAFTLQDNNGTLRWPNNLSWLQCSALYCLTRELLTGVDIKDFEIKAVLTLGGVDDFVGDIQSYIAGCVYCYLHSPE